MIQFLIISIGFGNSGRDLYTPLYDGGKGVASFLFFRPPKGASARQPRSAGRSLRLPWNEMIPEPDSADPKSAARADSLVKKADVFFKQRRSEACPKTFDPGPGPGSEQQGRPTINWGWRT